MRKKRSLARNGDCYQAAIEYLWSKYAFEKPETEIKIVHGEVAGQGPLEGLTFGHAWVEQGDVVVDPSNGRMVTMPRQLYYALGCISQINNMHAYDLEAVRRKILETKTYGPWDLKTASGL